MTASLHFKEKPIQAGWERGISAAELGINNVGAFY